MKAAIFRPSALFLFGVLCTAGIGYADGLNSSEVQFTGVVTSVTINGQGVGTLFVTLDTVQLRVLVNSRTIIQDLEGDMMTMDALAALQKSADPDTGLMVEVAGKFSSSGILATRIRVVDTPSDFHLRGHITRIQFLSQNQALISLLGITVLADTAGDPPVSIQMNGMDVPLADLKIGTKIEVSGEILGDETWSAEQILVLSASKKKGLVFFEGTIQAYDSTAGFIDVAVNGATGNVTRVLITTETKIEGTLAVGVYVLVVGTINPDYSFTAREIQVLAALEIKPDERKLAIGETATFTVKLRESAAAEVTVTLSVDQTGILEPLDKTTLVIPVGERTADFQVKGKAAGTVVITAAALGEQATATIVVGQLPDDPTTPDEKVRIAFAPDHIKLNLNDVREVVLLLQPPQKTEVTVEFTSSDETIVPLPTSRVLSKGTAMFKVAVQSADKTGSASVFAKLPAELGGGRAELVVTVEAKKAK